MADSWYSFVQVSPQPMNYKESKQILEKIKKAKKILVNCHRSPDPDSVGSALSLYKVLLKMKKQVEVVCPSSLPGSLKFLPFSGKVERVDFKKLEFSDYDILLILDSGDWHMVSGDDSVQPPDMAMVVIDHHKTNKGFGTINLVDAKVSSTAEILFLLYEDWKVKIDKNIAITLLAGIIGDTGVFQFPAVTPQTLGVAKSLMEKGADKNEIILNIYNSIELNLIKLWGEMLRRMKIDEGHKFVWSAIPFKIYEKYSRPESAKETAATMFARTVKGTDFGMVMVERKERILSISFRSRTDFDVSEIALALGGGGHRAAAAAEVRDLEFQEAVDKVLDAVRKFAKQK